MDQTSLQTQMVERQQLCFDIMNVVYESEYPITLETIAYKIKKHLDNELTRIVNHLVIAGYLQVQIRDGSVNYHKPTSVRCPLLPLPYYDILD